MAETIPLESEKDLQFLKGQFSLRAREKLALHLPQDASDGDPLRLRVQDLLGEFIDGVFERAAHGIVVNGLPATSVHEADAYEAFDTELSGRLQRMHQDIEAATLRVATLRKAVPKQIAEEARCLSDKLLAELAESEPVLEDNNNDAEPIDLPPLERQAEMSDTLTRIQQTLAKLNASIPQTIASLEQTRDTIRSLT